MSRGNVLVSSKEMVYENKYQDRRVLDETSTKKKATAKSIIFIVCYGETLVPKLRNLITAYGIFCMKIPAQGSDYNEAVRSYKSDLVENWKVRYLGYNS